MSVAKAHRWHIAEREYERHEKRRGRRFAFEHLDPALTALVVVDMVPFFVADNEFTMGIVANVNAIAASVRGAGGVVAWVVPDADPNVALTEEFYGEEIARRYQASGGSGALVDRLWHGLDNMVEDMVVPKTASSAFFPGRCDLHDRLQERAVDTVVIVGTVADVCCESSARDARTLGYRVIVAGDAVSAPNDDVLNASLRTIYRSFGDVRSTVEIQGLLQRGQLGS